ncbi:MAG: hypothetical protein ACOCX4_02980 [Planctomycetota bacterium]
MTMETTVPRYGRWHGEFDGDGVPDRVVFAAPDGRSLARPVFSHQPVRFMVDEHGYETIEPDGPARPAVRCTPDLPGPWRCVWWSGEAQVGETAFDCVSSGHSGFVGISPHDPRYFACSDGSPYVAIGLNLCWPARYALGTGREFETQDAFATLGAADYARWFRSLAANGGNFARLWLGMRYLQCEGEVAGEHDPVRFGAIDRVVALARRYGIRLKLCLEYFRTFAGETGMARALRHPDDGRSPTDMDEWFTSEVWQALWGRKVDALLARYGDDPAVFAWELWNEIDCCATSDFTIQCDWTRRWLRTIKAASPRNLVTNSLGSFDHDGKQALQDAFGMDEMDFQQVHRYLDQGAGLACCRTDPVGFSVEAVRRARREDRPVLLAETGAVNDCHTGPFRYYRADHDGRIFHDVTYPAFFAGAAGSGHIWHWDQYVDTKNLWGGFRGLAEALDGIAVDREGFVSVVADDDACRRISLCGKTVSLHWIRSRADAWDCVLRDGEQAPLLSGVTVDLGDRAPGVTPQQVRLVRPWPGDGTGDCILDGDRLGLPPFRHGLIVRVDAPAQASGGA